MECEIPGEHHETVRELPPFGRKSGKLNVVIDTPKGCRNKYAFDFKHRAYVLKTMLPRGATFPSILVPFPGTEADDGDPLDALVLMDEAAFTGCLIEARLIGVIEAKQTEDGKTLGNDRLIAVATESPGHQGVKSLRDLIQTDLPVGPEKSGAPGASPRQETKIKGLIAARRLIGIPLLP